MNWDVVHHLGIADVEKEITVNVLNGDQKRF